MINMCLLNQWVGTSEGNCLPAVLVPSLIKIHVEIAIGALLTKRNEFGGLASSDNDTEN